MRSDAASSPCLSVCPHSPSCFASLLTTPIRPRRGSDGSEAGCVFPFPSAVVRIICSWTFSSSPGLAFGPRRLRAAAGGRGWLMLGVTAASPPQPLRPARALSRGGSRAVTVGRCPVPPRPLRLCQQRAAAVPHSLSRGPSRALLRAWVSRRCA